MRNLLALDASEFASPETAGANFRGHGRRLAASARESAPPRFRRLGSGAAASEMATMIVILVAWALIAGYMFTHAAEGMLAATPAVSVASQGSAQTPTALA